MTSAAEVFPAVTLSTARLVLRPYRRDDAGGVHAIWHDDEYVRYAPVGLPIIRADLARAVEWCTVSVEERAVGARSRLRRRGGGVPVRGRPPQRHPQPARPA